MKSLAQILMCRFEFEELTHGYNMPEGSSIDTIDWFIENGHRSNSLRNGFQQALKFAKVIKDYDNVRKESRSRRITNR